MELIIAICFAHMFKLIIRKQDADMQMHPSA